MATPIAQLFVSVSADVTQAVAGLNSLENRLGATTNSFQQAAPAALAFEAAGGAIVAGLVGAVKVAADFEQGMANVRAVLSPAEAQQFGTALSDLAIKLGRDTVFTSREAAAGIEELVKAGIPAQAILDGAAEAATNLAAATGSGVPEAAAIAAQAMNAFGIQASDVTGAVDVLAGVVNASAADINDLRFGLQVVGPTAHSLGLSFRDTAEAIGLLTNAGETGQIAGTGLRQMLLELTPTTKPAIEEMKKLGLITADGKNQFFDATGKLKSFSDIAQILQIALRGMSAEERTAALNVLFTRDAINSASIIAEQGAAGVNRLTQAMNGITAASTAQERLNSLEGTLQNLQGSLEAAQIFIGSAFIPVIREMADHLKDLVNAFTALPEPVQQGVARLAAVIGVVLTLSGAFILLAPAISALPTAIGLMAGAFASLLPAIGLAAGIFFVLRQAWQRDIGGIRGVVDNFSNIGDIVQSALSGNIGDAVTAFIEDIKSISPELRSFIDNLQSQFSGLQSFITPILGNIGLVLDKAFSGDLSGAADTFRAILVALFPPLQSVFDIASRIGETVGPSMGGAFAFISSTIQQALPFLQNLGDQVLPTINTIGNTVGTFWSQTLAPAFAVVGDVIANQLVPGLTDLWQTTLPNLQKILPGLGAAWEGFSTQAGALAGSIAGGVNIAFADLQSRILPLLQEASDTLAKTWNDSVFPAFQKVGDFIGSKLGQDIVTLADSLATLGGPQVEAAANAIGTTLAGAFAQFGQQVGPFFSVIGAVGQFLLSLGNLIVALAQFIGVGELFGAIMDRIGGLFAGLAAIAASGFLNPIIAAFQVLGTIFSTVATNAESIVNVLNSLTNLINTMADALRNLPNFPALLSATGQFLTTGSTAGSPLTPTAPGTLAATPSTIPTINFNAPITLNNAGDLDSFSQSIANAIRNAATRVSPPVSNGGNPAIEGQFT
jgi:TP901 family phage tail tape measure protein